MAEDHVGIVLKEIAAMGEDAGMDGPAPEGWKEGEEDHCGIAGG